MDLTYHLSPHSIYATKRRKEFNCTWTPYRHRSNSIQRVADSQEFTRRIRPVISPASMHGIRVDATAIFELTSSTTVEENFTIM